MDKQVETRSISQGNSNWLDIAEVTSVFCSIGSSVASLFFKELFLALIPLSICVALNLVNRKRILSLTTLETKMAIAELAQQNQDNRTKFSQQLTQLQLSISNQLDKYQTNQNILSEQTNKQNTDFTQRIQELQRQEEELATNQNILSKQINKQNTDFTQRTQELQRQEEELATKIEYLSQIESSTRAIQSSPNSAELYFQRAINYQQMDKKKRAIEDYTKVIELDPSCALAHHNRGLVNSDLGNKKAAVEDLRKAAKFYFEQGDLDNYQKTKNMSQALHELNFASKDQDSEQVLASSLFS